MYICELSILSSKSCNKASRHISKYIKVVLLVRTKTVKKPEILHAHFFNAVKAFQYVNLQLKLLFLRGLDSKYFYWTLDNVLSQSAVCYIVPPCSLCLRENLSICSCSNVTKDNTLYLSCTWGITHFMPWFFLLKTNQIKSKSTHFNLGKIDKWQSQCGKKLSQ